MSISRRIKIFSLIALLLIFVNRGFGGTVGRLDPGIHAPVSRLAPVAEDNHFCFAVYGDIRKGTITHAKILSQLIALKQSNPAFRFVINTGDIVNDGSDAGDWLKLAQTPGFKELGAQIPTFPATGNHENIGQALPAMWLQFFAPVLEANTPFLWHRTDKPWYALYYGKCLFLFLDSNIMADTDSLDSKLAEEQHLWAAEQLKRPGFIYKFAVFHHPPFDSNISRLDNALRLGNYHLPGTERYFLDLFAENGVQAVFTGHMHRYERWLETRAGQKAYGLNWIISGGGGAPHAPHLPRILGDSDSIAAKLKWNWWVKELFSSGITGRNYLERNPNARLSLAFPRQESQLHNYFHYCIVDVSPQKILLSVYALDEQKDSFFLLDQAQLYP